MPFFRSLRVLSRVLLGASLLWALPAVLANAGPLLGEARADEATARLRDGGIVSGTIEVYEPGRRVVVRTASGEVITLVPAQLLELQITPSAPHATTPPAAPQLVAPVPVAPQVIAPTPSMPPPQEYQLVPVTPGWAPPQAARPMSYEEPLRLPSLRAPIIMMGLGATMVGVGAWLMATSYCSYETYAWDGGGYTDCSGTDRFAGVMMVGLGAPLLLVGGAVVLPIQLARRGRRRRQRAAARQLSLRPQLNPVTGQYGAAGTLRF